MAESSPVIYVGNECHVWQRRCIDIAANRLISDKIDLEIWRNHKHADQGNNVPDVGELWVRKLTQATE